MKLKKINNADKKLDMNLKLNESKNRDYFRGQTQQEFIYIFYDMLNITKSQSISSQSV